MYTTLFFVIMFSPFFHRKSFGNLKQFTAAKVPMFSTVGNHEWFDSSNYDFTAFKTRFDTPKIGGSDGDRQLYYSFDIGLAHWVMVSGYCQEMKSVVTQPCLAKGSPEMAVRQNMYHSYLRRLIFCMR